MDNPEFVVGNADDTSGAAHLPPGSRVGSFVIDRLLSIGAGHILYEAHDVHTGDAKVLKEFFPRGDARRSPDGTMAAKRPEGKESLHLGLSRFLDFARRLSVIDDDAFARTHVVFEANGTGYAAIERVDGNRLLDLIALQRIHPDDVKSYCARLLKGLNTLHRSGLVHGRLSPAHVLVDKAGKLKIVGLAGSHYHWVGADAPADANDEHYLPPEFWSARASGVPLTQSADVYGLGATLYHMVKGVRPHSSKDRLIKDQLPALKREPQLRAHYSDSFLGSIDRALSISTSDRFSDEAEWQHQLNRATNSSSSRYAIIAIALVTLLGVGGYVWTHSRKPPPPQPEQAWEDASAGKTFRDCSSDQRCPSMVWIPKGEVKLGNEKSEAGGNPARPVQFLNEFAVSQWEINRAEFAAFVAESAHTFAGNEPCGGADLKRANLTWRNPGFAQGDDEPVVCVSWNDAQAYVQWLSTKAGLPYRLLSEAEWEYVARAGSTSGVPWADSPQRACELANLCTDETKCPIKAKGSDAKNAVPCTDPYPFTAPASPNARRNKFGVHDMIGNVAELVEDCYIPTNQSIPIDGKAAQLPNCQRRSVRGGHFATPVSDVAFGLRGYVQPNQPELTIGLRVARDRTRVVASNVSK